MNCDPSNPKGSGMVNVWQEAFPVRFGAIDKSDRLTLDAVFQFFQEAAISHAENIGVGREDMARTGQVWILSRMSVLVERRPSYCETVKVRSWPCGFEKLFAIRNYEIRDKDDITVISAGSGWIIVDIEKRRPLRPQSVMEFMPLNQDAKPINPQVSSLTALTERKDMQKIAERKALYTDVDYNGHVNNVRYIQWIEDTFEPELQLLEKAEKMRFDINYLNEILEGEVVEILSVPITDEDKANNGTAFAFEGRKKNKHPQDAGQTAFRAELRLMV